MIKKLKPLFVGIGLIGTLLLFPVIHAIVLGLNFLLHAIVLGGHWLSARMPRFKLPRVKQVDESLFVSIHVPAYNEPPDVLEATLRSLAKLDWDNYEVLVIDNNTKDEAVWRPIEAVCEELGSKFRFFHVENMTGFKAGAMNYLRRFMKRGTDFILVVDADYQVTPDAIRTAMEHYVDKEVGLIQFPQAYRNTVPGNIGITLDFRHFFSTFMNMANRLRCVPSTGTMSFINVRALQAVGGFDEVVVTEDAELGLRLSLVGYRAVYVDKCVGHGLMPHDLESLKKQRWRWAFGNAQILKRNLPQLLKARKLSVGQKLGFVAHLTAWFNFNMIPTLTLLLLTPLVLLNHITPLQHYLLVFAGFTLVTYFVLKFADFFYGLRREGHTLWEITLAFFTHVGLGLINSTSWLRCLWNDKLAFVRTNKFLSDNMPGVLQHGSKELLLGVGLLICSVLLALAGFVVAPIGALLMAMGRFAILTVNKQMEKTHDISVELLEEMSVSPKESLKAA